MSLEGVYFHMGRHHSFIAGTASPTLFDYEELMMGSRLDIDSGLFTVPHSGTYQFTFSGMAGDGDNKAGFARDRSRRAKKPIRKS